jgi:hypothetical protein
MDRRTLIATATLAPLLALPGCVTGGNRLSLVEAIRRLLGLSAERAFATLLRENGFFDSAVARIDVPDALGGVRATSIVSAILRSGAFRDRLARQLNRAAEKGAALAAPLVTETIASLSVADAFSVVRGGPRAATDVLQNTIGPRLFEAMLPGIGDGLRMLDSQVVTQALKQVTGIDFAGLRDDVTRKASDGIYRAIAIEEAAIRANPSATGDPLLTAVFTLTR